MKERPQRRVVITGLGVIAPNGIGLDAFWQATSAGSSGITSVADSPAFAQLSAAGYPPIQVAGIVRNFQVQDYLERKLINRTDRMTHFALAAIGEALSDAHLQLAQEKPERVGAIIANTVGGVNYVLQQLEALYKKGPRAMSAYTAIAWLHVANVGQAAIRYNIRGYCKTPVNDTVGGLDALGSAYLAIQRGAADVIIAGGCEAMLNPFILRLLSRQKQYLTGADPQAYRPFDRRAAGLVLAEGAGMCIVEELEHAQRRGAPIYGEVVGYGQTNDASGLLPPQADGRRYARTLLQAMQEGGLQPQDISYVSLDGHALPEADQGEAQALQLAFGPHLSKVALSVPRTSIGHSYAAAGALDTIIALLALKHGSIPPTINCEQFDPHYEITLVRDTALALPPHASTALIGGRGTGGSNIALAVRRDV